jgi:hypothetical protein
MIRVLVLVIVSFDKPVYHDMLKVWKERCLVNRSCDVWFVQCKPASEWIGDIVNDIGGPLLKVQQSLNPPLSGESQSLESQSLESQSLESQSLESQSLSLEDRFELDIANKTLYVRGDECLIPGILHKTVEALSFFLHHWTFTNGKEGSKGNYVPFVWRTNLSSVLDFAGLQKYLLSLDKPNNFYGGYIGKALSDNHNAYDVKGGSLGERSSPIFFASGAGFLMSRDVALYLVENKDLLRWDLIDDVAIGALLEPRFGLVPIDRCWVQTGSEDIKGVFHFRCESYQHLRTVEFMQYVCRFL